MADDFDKMIEQSVVRPKAKGKKKPRRHKRLKKLDGLDKLALIIDHKLRTGYSWLDDETPGKDW